VRPCNQHVTQAVRLRETQPEDRSDKSRERASDECEQRERQQTSLALALAVSHLLPVSPSMPRIAIFALLISAGKAGDT
jgi:hypothetical protein